MPDRPGHGPRDQRAGSYVRQTEGYRAFEPRPLPPDPPLEIDADLQALLSRADRELGRLDGSIQTLPHPDLFVFMYVRKEAVLSSQIEGTQSSLQDVLAAEARLLQPSKSNDALEVIRHIRAMHHGLDRLGDLPVSIRLIKEIHAELLSNGRGSRLEPGELRRSQNWIGPAGCTLADATFVPPPPHKVLECLGQLETFLHANAGLPALLEIGLAHAQFETIHPFLDGNGRIGRLLITFLLCERKILGQPVLYLSHYFKRNRLEYYEHLQAVRDRGDWEAWLRFFLQGVIEVSVEATETARRILLLREEHRSAITERLGRVAGNGHRVLEHLFDHPIVSVNDVKGLIGTTYPAANDLVAKLEEIKILSEITGQARNRKFRYESYVRLFQDS
jgi:Fic family protein